jgi:HK97 family phage portal protein
MATTPATRTSTPGLFARIKGAIAEGSWRGPFFGTGEAGHPFLLGMLDDGWQRNLDVGHYTVRNVPAAYAAVMANARAVSQCWPRHMRAPAANGRFQRVTTSPAFRVFRQPNAYETWPTFMLNMIAAMQFEGASYAVAQRNDRGDVVALHRAMRGCCEPYVDQTGAVWYFMGANPLAPDLVGIDYMIPARDVLALRQHCPRSPLIGETPAVAAALALGVNVALSKSQAAFFSRMSRPSGVLTTEQTLNTPQMDRLRSNWEAQSTKLAQGGVPILGGGVKWVPMVINSEDAQLIEAQRLSIEDIARVYGVPLPIIGDLSHATLTNVDALIQFWLSTSLGSLLELVEKAFDQLFAFDTITEFTEFDQTALLRTNLEKRVVALTKGVQGGLFTPNEAREREGLPAVEGGDTAFLQSQMVPVSIAADPPPPAPPPAPAPAPGDDEEGEGNEDDDEQLDDEAAQRALDELADLFGRASAGATP